MDCGMAGLPVHHQLPKHWSKCFNALVHAFLDQVLWLVFTLHCRGKSQDHGSMLVLFMSCRHIQWVAISFSRGSSWPRDWTQVSCPAGGFFTDSATREAHCPLDIQRKWNIPETYTWNINTCSQNLRIISNSHRWSSSAKAINSFL